MVFVECTFLHFSFYTYDLMQCDRICECIVFSCILDKLMIEIRREQDSDIEDVFRIHQDAFQHDDEAQLVDKLRKNSQFNSNLSFVALMDNKIVGHILFTPLRIN